MQILKASILVAILAQTSAVALARDTDLCSSLGGGKRSSDCRLPDGEYFLRSVSRILDVRDPEKGLGGTGEMLVGIRRSDVASCTASTLVPVLGGVGGSDSDLRDFKACINERAIDVRDTYSKEIALCKSLPVANAVYSIYRGAVIQQRGTNYQRVLSDDSFPVCGFQLSPVFASESRIAALQSCLLRVGAFAPKLPLRRVEEFVECYKDELASL